MYYLLVTFGVCLSPSAPLRTFIIYEYLLPSEIYVYLSRLPLDTVIVPRVCISILYLCVCGSSGRLKVYIDPRPRIYLSICWAQSARGYFGPAESALKW